jgi:methionyl-tRNA formyltransferase
MAARLEARTGHTFHFIGAVADLTVERLQAIRPRFVFFPHWSHRIDARIHQQFECVIFHMTDLPFGRGGSPLQNLIVRGIYDTRISALRCVEEMDAGPVYLKAPLSLHGSAEEIFVRAARIIEDLIVEILRTQPEPVAQSGSPTVFARRKPEESDLAGAQSLDELFDRIRMLDAEGYPRAFLDAGPFRLEFTRASRKSGSVVADVRVTLVERRK